MNCLVDVDVHTIRSVAGIDLLLYTVYPSLQVWMFRRFHINIRWLDSPVEPPGMDHEALADGQCVVLRGGRNALRHSACFAGINISD